MIASLLVEKAKAEVDYNNPKWYKNIIFNEEALKMLQGCFLNSRSRRMIEELGDNALTELQNRLKLKDIPKKKNSPLVQKGNKV
jgi:hypothetical protein